MVTLLTRLMLVLCARFASRARLEAEKLVLRQQLFILNRRLSRRLRLRNIDRVIFVWLYRQFPSLLDAIIIVKPETFLRWHHRGFSRLLAWKSRRCGGRRRIESADQQRSQQAQDRVHLVSRFPSSLASPRRVSDCAFAKCLRIAYDWLAASARNRRGSGPAEQLRQIRTAFRALPPSKIKKPPEHQAFCAPLKLGHPESKNSCRTTRAALQLGHEADSLDAVNTDSRPLRHQSA